MVGLADGLVLHGISTRNDERRAAAAKDWGVKTYASVDELLDDGDVQLVVIDTLARFRPQRRARGNLYDEDYAAGVGLVDLAQKHGVCIVVVHHLRKQIADDPIDEVSGTAGLTGVVDGVLILKRGRGKADGFLDVTGRDVEEAEWALRWDAQSARWSIVGGAEEYRRSEARKQVLDTLKLAGKPLTPREVAELTGGKRNAVKGLMRKMAQDGEITACGEGKYETR